MEMTPSTPSGGRAKGTGFISSTLAAPVTPAEAALRPLTFLDFAGQAKTIERLQVMVGAAHQLHPSLEAGAVGAILAFACIAPTACYEIYAAWKEDDAELAGLKQERIAVAGQRVVGDFGIPGVKYGMDINGYFGGPARLPLLPLTGEAKGEIERLLADVRN